MKRILLVVVFSIAFLAGCSLPGMTQSGVTQPIQIQPAPVQVAPQPQACTEEAKICPDGSAVGRTGPNCEFAPCPGETTSCSCPEGYRQEGEACNPNCYYGTPKCLMPSVKCE